MNPNTPQPSFELPVPQHNSELAPGSSEQSVSRPETFTQPPVARPAPAQPLPPAQPPIAPQPMVPLATGSSQPHTGTNPTIAEDSDLIEKEWVEKAKQIVAATREDPHTQNKEISRFKADYLKKRYNKDIKIEES